MTQNHTTPAPEQRSILEEDAKEMRRLSHDLNNALEIIIQASYLVGTSDLPEGAKQWVTLLEQGVQQAATRNNALREYIRMHS